jgi:hypothetical protein
MNEKVTQGAYPRTLACLGDDGDDGEHVDDEGAVQQVQAGHLAAVHEQPLSHLPRQNIPDVQVEKHVHSVQRACASSSPSS